MADLTLYGAAFSSYVWTTRMALEEKGVSFDYQPLPPHDKELMAVNPFGKVPGFRHGDVTLFETAAITRYVDEVFDGPALVPSDPVQRALVTQWISAVNDYIYDAMIRRYVLQYVMPRTADGKPDRGVIDGALKRMRRQVEVLDAAYGGRPFVVGGSLTLADLFLAPILAYVWDQPEGKELLDGCPNIVAAWPSMTSRPSFQHTDPRRSG
jgi:glutathione S-transferase